MKSDGRNPVSDPVIGRDMPVEEHLTELRRRILICLIPFVPVFCFMFAFSGRILGFLMLPAAEQGCELLLFQITDGFSLRVRAAVYTALIAELPLIAAEAACFISPGLYPKERKLLTAAAVLAVCGMTAGVLVFVFRGAALIIRLWKLNGMDFPASLSASDYFHMWTIGAAAAGILCCLPAAAVIWLLLRSRRKKNDQT